MHFRKLRELIARQVAADTPFLSGEIELDESYFGGHRKGKRGRGAAGKVIVFINGIENFWNQAKRYMRRFNGISKDQFSLFLKECVWTKQDLL